MIKQISNLKLLLASDSFVISEDIPSRHKTNCIMSGVIFPNWFRVCLHNYNELYAFAGITAEFQ